MNYSNQERERLLGEIRRLAPDAQLVDVYRGSIVMRFVSSLRSYETLHRLSGLGVLPAFFGVDTVSLSAPEGLGASRRSRSESLVDRLALALEGWRPETFRDERGLEAELLLWIADWLSNNPDLKWGDVSREPTIPGHPNNARADLLVTAGAPDGEERILVELATVRNRRSFLMTVERLLYYTGPAIIVVYGVSTDLGRVRADAERIGAINPQLRVAFVGPAQRQSG